jgi:hypothetical protein
MKIAAALLLSSTQAVRISPDVFGKNGENYQNNSPNFDLSLIGIDKTTVGSGPKCTTGDWAIVHWTGSLTDGRLVTDSRAEGLGYPKTFAVGKSEVFKCWDLALPQLRKGDKATIECPARFVWGGAYTLSPLGGEPVPLWSPVVFNLEVLDCGRNPESFAYYDYSQPHTTTLQPGKCFYLVSKTAADQNTERVLTAQDGVLGVEHKVVDEREQQWYINPADGTLYNAAHADRVVDFSDASALRLAAPGASGAQTGYDYTADDQVIGPKGLALTYDYDTKTVKFAGNERTNN